jgi:RNA polymerase sigma-70 factor (ECF subfamily)
VQTGSEAHFNALYARYFPRIYGFLAQRTRSRADAEELAQEVFTAVFRSACGYGDRATPLSWIYGIARNTALNYVRRQQQERAREERWLRDGAIRPASEWAFTPEERLREGQLGAEIERRMSRLAEWQRDAFRLRHLEDASIEEISRRTARSADAVRSSLYRAKRMLFETAEIDDGGSDE